MVLVENIWCIGRGSMVYVVCGMECSIPKQGVLTLSLLVYGCELLDHHLVHCQRAYTHRRNMRMVCMTMAHPHKHTRLTRLVATQDTHARHVLDGCQPSHDGTVVAVYMCIDLDVNMGMST